MALVIFFAALVTAVVAMFAVDWASSHRQERRLRGGLGRDGVDEFKVRDDRIVNASYASFTASSVKSRNPRS